MLNKLRIINRLEPLKKYNIVKKMLHTHNNDSNQNNELLTLILLKTTKIDNDISYLYILNFCNFLLLMLN